MEDYDDWCEPTPRAFCDQYVVHEPHVYQALNRNMYDCPGLSAEALAYDPGTCHHGMSADLCMDPVGPHHFGTREWEMANGDW